MCSPDARCLYAVVSAEVRPRTLATPGLQVISCASLVAVVGPVPSHVDHAAALEHDRVVGWVLERCVSVVPFRAGVNLPCEAGIRELICANEARLHDVLARVAGRVEMGLKIKGPHPPHPALLQPFHELARDAHGRREHRRGPVFDGSYLIARTEVTRFWDELQRAQQESPEVPMLGSGPWAPYSFCDVTLRPGGQATELTHG